MPTPATGYNVRALNWGVESTFGTEATNINAPFGKDVEITSPRNPNLQEVMDLNSQDVQEFIDGNWEGTVTVTSTLASAYLLKLPVGTLTTTGTNPKTHTISPTNTLDSVTIIEPIDLSTDANIKYLGCVANSQEVSGALNEVIKVTTEFFNKTELKSTTLGTTTAESESVFHIKHASIEFPVGSAITNIQTFSVKIERNLHRQYEIGSRFVAALIPQARKYTISLTTSLYDASLFLEKLYGSSTAPAATGTSTATFKLTITNGGAGTAERSITWTFANLSVSDENLPVKPIEIINEEVTLRPKSLTSIVYINNSAAPSGVGAL